MVQILVLAQKFKGEDQKKTFRHEVSGFILVFTIVFHPGTRLYSHLGLHKQYFGGAQAHKCTSVAPDMFLFGAQSSLGGHRPEMLPVVPGL